MQENRQDVSEDDLISRVFNHFDVDHTGVLDRVTALRWMADWLNTASVNSSNIITALNKLEQFWKLTRILKQLGGLEVREKIYTANFGVICNLCARLIARPFEAQNNSQSIFHCNLPSSYLLEDNVQVWLQPTMEPIYYKLDKAEVKAINCHVHRKGCGEAVFLCYIMPCSIV